MAEPDQIARPRAVERAVTLLWLSVILVIGKGVWSFFTVIAPATAGLYPNLKATGVVGIAILYAIILGVSGYLFGKIAEGKNWGRIVVTVLFVLNLTNLISFASGLSATIGNPIRPDSLTILIDLAAGYAMVLLYTKPGSAWFGPGRLVTAES